MGLIDTIAERSSMYRVLQPPQLTNQYAAVPSLHVGWNLLIGIALFRGSSRFAVRLLGIASPGIMFVAVLVTANHYLVDTVAGASVALIGLALAYRIQTRSVADEAMMVPLDGRATRPVDRLRMGSARSWSLRPRRDATRLDRLQVTEGPCDRLPDTRAQRGHSAGPDRESRTLSFAASCGAGRASRSGRTGQSLSR